MTDIQALYRQYYIQQRRQELLDTLAHAKSISHRLPDGRYVLPIHRWVGMAIETPKIYDPKEIAGLVREVEIA